LHYQFKHYSAMFLRNTKYKQFQGFCQPKPIHRKGDRLYIASIEKTGKRSNPIDFVSIPVKIISTQITTFFEERRSVIFYEVVNMNNENESFIVDESRLFLSMKFAYTQIAEYLGNVIETVEDRMYQNTILEKSGIEPIGAKSKIQKQLLAYLKGREFQAIITAENLDVSN